MHTTSYIKGEYHTCFFPSHILPTLFFFSYTMSFTIRPLATGLPRFGSRVLLANAARRAPLTSTRAYTTGTGSTKKSSNNTLLFLGLAALGGAGGYYYHNSQQGVKVLDSNKKKDIDYNQVYKDIAELLEDNEQVSCE